LGVWPAALGTLPAHDAQQLQAQLYLSGARARMREGASWCLDKSLHTWQWLPMIAAVLPGSVFLRMTRDPRDAAISMLLSNFHPRAFGWTSDLASIRRVMQAERALVPRALEVLGLRSAVCSYEDLVSDPVAAVSRCMNVMGLELQPACLTPEANARTVLTLSHAQVRAPISKASIGRWRNYEFAFGEAWESWDDRLG
ncbi:MAG: sulfotransferase, partial [Phycisphaerae bacterium]|nr:sulfotransferase [Phycisphaerae bacterium]